MEKIITSAWLDKHNACSSGSHWFASRFPDGGAKISDVLVKIVIDQGADSSWVAWLMSRAKYNSTDWITSLPDGLSVGGSLYLSGTGITSLPDGLSVGGYLYLSGTGITSLPDGLSVGGSLDLSGTGITSLPDGLSVGGYLDLRGTGITSLPDGLSVGGYLDLRGCKKINKSKIPEHLKDEVIW